MKVKKLTVAEALQRAEQIELNMTALERTAPRVVAALGGRDALSRASEMTCIGPVPRLDADAWERMAAEYEDNRLHGRSCNRGV
jgi:hypothetical protein